VATFQFVFFEFAFRWIHFIARVALKSAIVFGHVHVENALAGEHSVADLTGIGTRVRLQVLVAGESATVRLFAHRANVTPLALDYLIRRYLLPGDPRSDRCDELTVCK
jgi:hypothetical protein